MKVCSKCKVEKTEESFCKNKAARDGLNSKCRECCSADNARYYKANPEKERARIAKWRKDNPEKAEASSTKWRKDNPEEAKYKDYKSGAKCRGYSFDLTTEQFLEFYWKKPCSYCGCEIETVGIDRVDNKKGYSLDNCVPCCTTCNKMKLTLTRDEFISKIQGIYKHTGGHLKCQLHQKSKVT